MNIPKAEQCQIENGMIFRRVNENMGDDLETLEAMHIEDGNFHLLRDEDLNFFFKCECSDENCDKRLSLLLTEYQGVHRNRSKFIVLPGHQVESIEKFVTSLSRYNIVMKINSTSEPSNALNETSIINP